MIRPSKQKPVDQGLREKGIKSGALPAKKVHWDDLFLARKLE